VGDVQVDIAIIGGGIAGLWTLNRLKKLGYSVVLLEKSALGAEQTIKSQGIIHGGLKYALTGQQNSAQAALTNMPQRWQDCLNGAGEIDLSAVEVLSDCQYMWSNSILSGSLATLFASKALQSHVSTEEQWPDVITNSKIRSKLYKLSEIVLNVPTLIDALARPHADKCIKNEFEATHSIKAQKYIHTAGQGNTLGDMQLRPLHMVMVKSPQLDKLYGHCIAMGTTPRITITTHTAQDGTPVWYLGGKLAEDGVKLETEKQISKAQKELKDIFPKLDLHDAKWASFFVSRAEAKQAVFHYIEMVYNTTRRHTTNDRMSPNNFERAYFRQVEGV